MVPSHQFGLVIRSLGFPILLVSLRKRLERRVMKLTNLMSQSMSIVATIPPFVVACWMNRTLLIWVSKTEIMIAGMHSFIITIHSPFSMDSLEERSTSSAVNLAGSNGLVDQ